MYRQRVQHLEYWGAPRGYGKAGTSTTSINALGYPCAHVYDYVYSAIYRMVKMRFVAVKDPRNQLTNDDGLKKNWYTLLSVKE